MIELIFTIDYEIYGNGIGSLFDLVYEPADKLCKVFDKKGKRIVFFIEALELEKIKLRKTDKAISLVENQIYQIYNSGHEIALHLHPQWSNAQFQDGKWILDYSEYNFGSLGKDRIIQIVDNGLEYLRKILKNPRFTPLSFRAGNWLFQPAEILSSVLSERGLRIDSSVFKGGLQNQFNLDYRPAMRNGYFWKFSKDTNIPDRQGVLLEIPIFTKMVFLWQMATEKRVRLQQKGTSNYKSTFQRLQRIVDFIRLRYPMKLDFCRMSYKELLNMIEKLLILDRSSPKIYRPIVAIGHTKDLVETETLEKFIDYLEKNNIAVSKLQNVYENCINEISVLR